MACFLKQAITLIIFSYTEDILDAAYASVQPVDLALELVKPTVYAAPLWRETWNAWDSRK
ncbi:hypothetical protein AC622_03690 [Bacillus sp. FJAT-27916]|nr:hypothetical protein AC622_03690 [Bacillus sp. FJAT-27916]